MSQAGKSPTQGWVDGHLAPSPGCPPIAQGFLPSLSPSDLQEEASSFCLYFLIHLFTLIGG